MRSSLLWLLVRQRENTVLSIISEGTIAVLNGAWRNTGRSVARREWAGAELVGAATPGAGHSGAGIVVRRRFVEALRTRAGRCDVIGNMSSTAWYAAVRGLFRFRNLSNRSLIHHSTLSQSMHGSSMPLAKCIYPTTIGGCGSASVTSSPPGTARPGRGGGLNFMAGALLRDGLPFQVSC
jgi:hypothetical protein